MLDLPPSPPEEPLTGTRSLRVEPPDLDPDDAFVARLALAARYSPRPVKRAHRFRSGRLLLATAGIAVVTTGGAYAAGVLAPLGPLGPLGPRHESPPHHEKSPASTGPTEGTEPVPASPKGNGKSGTPSAGRPSDPKEGVGKPTGLPTGPPSGVPSGGPSEHPTHPTHPTKKPKPTQAATSKPTDKPSGQPTDQPGGKPTDNPSGQPTDKPTGKPGGKPSPGPKPAQSGS
jgi:hypothetical protein